MIFGSVCSGIEAASCAWYPLGWEAAFVSEIEPFPCSVLKQHYPDVPNWGDMTKFKEWPDADVNVLVGGTPCQSFSVAGLRKGLDDPRGNLMLTYLAIADRYRPEWVVWENVPGVLSSNGGRDFASFLRGLAELGYGFAYRILDAQYFGVAQRRRRVFVVGHIGDWRRAAAVLFERHSLQGHPAPRREKGQKATASLRACPPASGGQGTDAEHTVMMLKDVAPCLDAMMDKKWGSNQWVDSGQFVFCASDGQKNASIQNNLAPTLTKQDEQPYIAQAIGWSEELTAHTELAGTIQYGGQGGRHDGVAYSFSGQMSVPQVDRDLMQTLGAKNPMAVAFPINTQIAMRHEAMGESTGMGIGDSSDPAFTLQSAHSHAVAVTVSPSLTAYNMDSRSPQSEEQQRIVGAVYKAAMQVRRLTPRECERLQGFPDNYTLVQHRNKPAADGPRYKALGNSMAVPVMAWIGRRIAMVEQLKGASLP